MSLQRLIYLSTVRGGLLRAFYFAEISVWVAMPLLSDRLTMHNCSIFFRCRFENLFALLLIAAFGVNEEFKEHLGDVAIFFC